MDHSAAIVINNLTFSWPQDKTPLLHIPEWQVSSGERLFIYGRSGTGKSTLLNILSGILLPLNGNVHILNQDITQLSQHQRDRYRARHMGIIFQQFNLIPYLTVADNIHLSEVFSGCKLSSERLHSLLSALELEETVLTKKAIQLSVGQQQRVAVARALYHHPQLIIADEPTSALDSETRDSFIQLLLTQSQENNSTVLFVSHDRSLAKQFDKIIDLQDLNQGKVHHAA